MNDKRVIVNKGLLDKLSDSVQALTGTAGKMSIQEMSDAVSAKRKRPNWNQNDPTKEDYIENRPFYKEVNNLEFSDKDYSTPLNIEDVTVYKLSDTTPNFEGQDNIKITYGTSADNLRTKEMHLVTREADYVEGDDSQLVSLIFYDDSPPDFQGDVNKDIETIVATSAFEGVGDVPLFLILYKSKDVLGIGTQFDKGIYIIMSPLTPDEEQLLYKLYKISTVKYHKIPPEFLPETIIQRMIDNSINESVSSLLGGAS